jgi:hypothetical protein
MFIYAESPLENAEDVSAAAGEAVALVKTEHVLFATTGPAAAADATTVTVMFPRLVPSPLVARVVNCVVFVLAKELMVYVPAVVGAAHRTATSVA